MRRYPQQRNFHPDALPRFGINANSIKVVTIPLDEALDEVEYYIGGSVLWAYDSGNLDNYLDIKLNTHQNDPIRFKQGMFLKGIDYNKLIVSAPAQPGGYLTMLHCVEGEGNLAIENPSGDYTEIKLVSPNNYVSLADVVCPTGATTLVCTGAVQSTVFLQAKHNNSDVIYVCSSGGTGGMGLYPGDTFSLQCSDNIYVRNDTGVSQTVGVAYTKQT